MKAFPFLTPGLVVLLVALVIGDTTYAELQESEEVRKESVSFFRDIRPILQVNCQGCHQPAKAGADLVLTSHTELMRGVDGESSIVPGRPDQSFLVDVITPFDGDPPDMPKDQPPLSVEDVERIRRWIAEGAEDDTPSSVTQRYSSDEPPVYERPPVLTSLDFSPDGRLLAVSGYNEVLLHHADGSGLVARLVGLSERIESVAFSPDGALLAVAGGSPARMGELQVWRVQPPELILSSPVTFDTIYGASWSDDGTRIAFGCSDNTVRAIDAETGAEVLYQGAHNDWVLGTAFSTDGTHLVSVSRDRSLKLIKLDTQQFIDNITSITPGALEGGLMTVDRHPLRDELLVAGADGLPKVFQMYREKEREIGDDYNLVQSYEAMPGRIFSARWRADGTRIVAASSHRGGGEVRAYDAETGDVLWTATVASAIYSVAFRPDGSLVAAAGFDGRVRLFAGDTGTLVAEFLPVPLAEAMPIEATHSPSTALDARPDSAQEEGDSR